MEELAAQAEKGLTPCQIELANCYLVGRDVNGNALPQDYFKAKHWLERAHEKGAFTATVMLGTVYEEGKGVSVDIPKAIELYELAVQRDAYLPCLYLARIYAVGKGVEQSQQLAAEWYQKVLFFEGKVDDQGEMDEAREFLRANSDNK